MLVASQYLLEGGQGWVGFQTLGSKLPPCVLSLSSMKSETPSTPTSQMLTEIKRIPQINFILVILYGITSLYWILQT